MTRMFMIENLFEERGQSVCDYWSADNEDAKGRLPHEAAGVSLDAFLAEVQAKGAVRAAQLEAERLERERWVREEARRASAQVAVRDRLDDERMREVEVEAERARAVVELREGAVAQILDARGVGQGVRSVVQRGTVLKALERFDDGTIFADLYDEREEKEVAVV